MDLCLLHNDPLHTHLVAEDGLRYAIETPRPPEYDAHTPTTTTIVRIDSEISTGHVCTEVGRVEARAGAARMRLCLTDMELVLHPFDATTASEKLGALFIWWIWTDGFVSSWTFTGPDNRPYKWQIFIHSPVLILNDNSNTLLARYHHAKLGIVSRSRRATLEVLPAGVPTTDLIVVTFVSFMKQRVTIEYRTIEVEES
ncbi:hypothetical protein Hypma_013594 [Hypsizygus marmoreus]|uniref:DUF6593 domain-containing protein n=1 Tax=Hypsizygus marmoreus TaxID=39966 RepID=A0A369JKH7_HYPMA|nr:hypothetical protein Hypma_013594 [Hypsizygus marmoreus]